jgi:lipopolysaccharide export system permease protein
MIYKEIAKTIGFIAVGFIVLFLFFDFVDELSKIGKSSPFGTGTYGFWQATLYVLLLIPGHLYELLPMVVLIGATWVLARLAKSSEFTILRTVGLSPKEALKLILGLGVFFMTLTFVIGDYITPITSRTGQLLKTKYLGKITAGQTGAWLKEKNETQNYAINVSAVRANNDLVGVQIYEFHTDGTIKSIISASAASFKDNHWLLKRGFIKKFNTQNSDFTVAPNITQERFKELVFTTSITSGMVGVALLKPEKMSTIDLYQYMRHLDKNAQSAQLYEIEFWRKIFYPIGCMVMLILALPFAYLHFRTKSISTYVFIGILIGISFFVLNTLVSYFGNVNNWSPLLTAAAPSLFYSIIALAAFSWQALRR